MRRGISSITLPSIITATFIVTVTFTNVTATVNTTFTVTNVQEYGNSMLVLQTKTALKATIINFILVAFFA